MAASSTSATVRVTGLKELQRALKDADPELRRGIRAAGKAAAEVVKSDALSRVPRRSGRLADSIGTGTTLSGAYVKAGTAARVPYAGPVHFGWPKHHIKPNPFLYDALDARTDEVLATYEDAIDAVLAALDLT